MTGGRPFADCALPIALLALSIAVTAPAHAQEPAETDAEEDLLLSPAEAGLARRF